MCFDIIYNNLFDKREIIKSKIQISIISNMSVVNCLVLIQFTDD